MTCLASEYLNWHPRLYIQQFVLLYAFPRMYYKLEQISDIKKGHTNLFISPRMWIKKFLNVNIINFKKVDKPRRGEGGGQCG